MDHTEVPELMRKLLQARIDGDVAAQDAVLTELARAKADQAPGLKARVRAMQAMAVANTGNDNA